MGYIWGAPPLTLLLNALQKHRTPPVAPQTVEFPLGGGGGIQRGEEGNIGQVTKCPKGARYHRLYSHVRTSDPIVLCQNIVYRNIVCHKYCALNISYLNNVPLASQSECSLCRIQIHAEAMCPLPASLRRTAGPVTAAGAAAFSQDRKIVG